MGFVEYTYEEIQELVDDRLHQFIDQDETRFHMTKGFLESVFRKGEMFPIFYADRPESPIIYEMFLRGDYETLVRWGDSMMVICGWFPEWTSKERKASLGMGHYVGIGIECYNNAVNLAVQGDARYITADPTLVNRLSDRFTENSGFMFRLREEIGEKKVLDYTVAKEFQKVFGIKPNYTSNIIKVGGFVKGYREGLSVIPGGEILDSQDIDYIPVDKLVEIAVGKEQEKKDNSKRHLRIVKD